MKIVCEACQAKYSIADDKVRGKVFKIRCKKCSHVIVVRGAGEGASWRQRRIRQLALLGARPGPRCRLAHRGRRRAGRAAVGGRHQEPAGARRDHARDVHLERGSRRLGQDRHPGRVRQRRRRRRASRRRTAALRRRPSRAACLRGDRRPARTPAAGVPRRRRRAAAGGSRRRRSVLGAHHDRSADDAATAVALGGARLRWRRWRWLRRSHGRRMAWHRRQPRWRRWLTGQRHENSVLFSLSNLEALAKPGRGAAAGVARHRRRPARPPPKARASSTSAPWPT